MLQPIAPHVARINVFNFVNAYVVETADGMVLVDSGVRPALPLLRNALRALEKPLLGVALTHGHFDHVGCAGEIAREWKVPVWVHRLEAPFLTDKDYYPPADPTVGGALALVNRAMPTLKLDLCDVLEMLPDNGRLDALPGWQIVETPGHSPGHVSLWHEDDRVLLAGDALATADFDAISGLATLHPQKFGRGGSPFTIDWDAARDSVGKLADLEPVVVAAGHGIPMSGGDVPQELREFFRDFAPPAQGRYVTQSVQSDENGVAFLPPAPRDDFALKVGIGALGLAALGALVFQSRARRG